MNTPPTRDQLNDTMAAAKLPWPSLHAALHLALPSAEVADIAVQITATTLHWRDVTVARTNDPTADAAALAAAGAQRGDRWLDLTDTSTLALLKITASGAGRTVFGLHSLHGGPLLTLGDDVDSDDIAKVVELWDAQRDRVDLPAVLSTERGHHLIVDTSSDHWGHPIWNVHSTRSEVPAIAPRRRARIDELVDAIGHQLGVSVSVDRITNGDVGDSYDVAGVLDGWSIVVPVLVTDTGVQVGVGLDDTVPAADAACVVPAGFELCGSSRDDSDAVVAQHTRTGLRVLISVD